MATIKGKRRGSKPAPKRRPTKSAPKRRTSKATPDEHETFQVRWSNFRSLRDTGWVNVRPLTIVIGANGSGKTSLIAPLLLLKQTLQSSDRSLALNTRGALFNAGAFQDIVSDRDPAQDLVLSLRFHHHDPGEKKLEPPPTYPPGELELAFSQTANSTWPTLSRYCVRDIYGQDMLTRARTSDGYSLTGIDMSESQKAIVDAIRTSPPIRFLFGTEAVFRAYFSERDKGRNGKRDRQTKGEMDLGVSASIYMQMVSRTSSEIESLLSRISFIGPLRHHPQRFYELSGEHPASVGVHGELAPELLYRNRDGKLLENVNSWIKRFDFGATITCTPLGNEIFTLDLKRDDGVTLNLADAGFGLSQILPLIVECARSKPKELLIAEQPEIHLNPKLQTVLADLVVDATKRGTRVLIETHSEHMLLRLRRLIAEGKIAAEKVALLYADKSTNGSTLRAIQIDSRGQISGDEWPRGFFEDSLREALGLAQAAANAR